MAAAASSGANLVVFPEFGVTGSAATKSRDLLALAGEDVPAAADGALPCGDPGFAGSPVLTAAPCVAKRNGVAVAVNMVDKKPGPLLDNAEVVLDEAGRVAARYYKSQVWFHAYGQPDTPDHVVYNSSFGGPIGFVTCFDIVFGDPAVRLRKAGIANFIYGVAHGSIGKALLIKPWAWLHSATLISSNLALGSSGIFTNGTSSGGVMSVDVPGTGGGGLVVSQVATQQ